MSSNNNYNEPAHCIVGIPLFVDVIRSLRRAQSLVRAPGVWFDAFEKRDSISTDLFYLSLVVKAASPASLIRLR